LPNRLALRSPHTDGEEAMGRGGIGGRPVAVDMETVDSTRAFVRDVKRIVIKVTDPSICDLPPPLRLSAYFLWRAFGDARRHLVS
jgi:hypothetical protein